MTDKIDLHLHSYYSDGTLCPEELVRLAKERGYRAISLTDHDCLEGISEALEAGERYGVEVIPGVELSVQYEEINDIHILGYLFDFRDEKLNEKLDQFRGVRRERGRKIVDKINAHLGKNGRAPLDYQAIAATAKSALGRPHIARKLVEMGHVADMVEAFDRFLTPYDVPKAYFTPAQAVEMMHAAGGVAVLAHPGYTFQNQARTEQAVSYFASLGMDGLEGLYGNMNSNNQNFSRYLTNRYRLVMTGGSDYHGDLGRFGAHSDGLNIDIPYSIIEALKRSALR